MVIARLETETIVFEIKNQIEYFMINEGVQCSGYESFHVEVLRKKGGRLIDDIVLYNQSPELCAGNIGYLVTGLGAYLNGTLKEIRMETTEPDFEIIFTSYSDDTSEFQFWINQGSFGGPYSDDAIGIRLILGRKELETFYQQLKNEYHDRKMLDYKLK